MAFSRKESRDGERTPPWHRVAYIDWVRRVDVCYPIGIHLVARLFRRVWEWSLQYKSSAMERMTLQAGEAIRRDARQQYEKEAASRCSQCAYPLGGQGDAIHKMRALLKSEPYTPEATE